MGSSYCNVALGAERGQMVILQRGQDCRNNYSSLLGLNYLYHHKASVNDASSVNSIFRHWPNIFWRKDFNYFVIQSSLTPYKKG